MITKNGDLVYYGSMNDYKMNDIFQALYQGALLFNAGNPVRDVFDIVCNSHKENKDVSDLFNELRVDWDSRNSTYPLKMIGPFIEREEMSPDFIIATAFTEAAAATSMIDVFWKTGAYCYLLKKHLSVSNADENDLKFSRTVLDFFSPDHKIFDYFETVSNGRGWTKEAFRSSEEKITFEEWAEVHAESDLFSRMIKTITEK